MSVIRKLPIIVIQYSYIIIDAYHIKHVVNV